LRTLSAITVARTVREQLLNDVSEKWPFAAGFRADTRRNVWHMT